MRNAPILASSGRHSLLKKLTTIRFGESQIVCLIAIHLQVMT